MSDRGRKYQTFNGDLKTKSEINNEYYFKYIRGRMFENIEPIGLPYIDEDLFFKLTPEEVKIYFFGNKNDI